MINSLISIIVPIYNSEKYIRRCIESILSQTFKDFELLLIDDGSKDNSGRICDEYAEKDSRVRVFHKKNGGVSSARNFGIDNAKGEWVTFIDSDDWVEAEYIANFVFDCDLSIQGYFDDKKCIRYKNKLVKKSIGDEYIRNEYILGPYCKMFRLNIINQFNIRFDLKLTFGEDILFLFNYLLYTKKMKVLSYCGYHYKINNGGLTSIRYNTEYYIRVLLLFNNALKELKVEKKTNDGFIWNLMEYWILYPNMKYAYTDFDFDKMYIQLYDFIDCIKVWNAPKKSFTSMCFGAILKMNNPRLKYLLIRFVHLYVRRSENKICAILNSDFKKI